MFEIDIKNKVDESCAKQICKLNPNGLPHRKFDGVLKPVDFKFKSKDQDSHKMFRIHDVLGNGGISKFIDKEEIINKDFVLSDSSDSESDSESDFKRRGKN